MSIHLLAAAAAAPASLYETAHQFVTDYKIHPILVNFTAALIPISFISDVLNRITGKTSLRDTGWWTLCFAAIITPLTALAGWLFWSHDMDDGVRGMTIHKWLGTSAAVLLIGAACLTTGAGWITLVGLALFAAHLGWQVKRIDIDDPALCLRLFRSNREAGLILFAALLIDAAV